MSGYTWVKSCFQKKRYRYFLKISMLKRLAKRKLHIKRIMKKYDIICSHRKANPYWRMMKATKEHTVLPNLLNRNFKQETLGKVLLTEISYLFF